MTKTKGIAFKQQPNQKMEATTDIQNRLTKLFLDLSLHWSQFTVDEKHILLGLMGLEGAQGLAALVSAFRVTEKSLKMQFFPVAEAIIDRQIQRINNEKAVDAQIHEELQKDYCVLYEINQRMEKRLDRLERKAVKRQAKQERVKRYFALRGKKPWQLQQKEAKLQSRPEEKLNRPLKDKKRLVKGTDEYDEEKARLDEELDAYQKLADKSKLLCSNCLKKAEFPLIPRPDCLSSDDGWHDWHCVH